MTEIRPIKRALISVSDKAGVVQLAQQLAERGVEILSTGGTAKLLVENGITVKGVSSVTGFPEMMDGRIKTLHPRIHGGLLGRRGKDEDVMSEQIAQNVGRGRSQPQCGLMEERPIEDTLDAIDRG